MSAIEQIEDAVRQLSPKELASFRDWFAEYDSEIWDRQLEKDITAGRLDSVAQDALDPDRICLPRE
jgi:hypothetical protein